jgi:hypothetical protein
VWLKAPSEQSIQVLAIGNVLGREMFLEGRERLRSLLPSMNISKIKPLQKSKYFNNQTESL